MDKMESKKAVIQEGKAILGIELGSTRIKAVLIDEEETVYVKNHLSFSN